MSYLLNALKLSNRCMLDGVVKSFLYAGYKIIYDSKSMHEFVKPKDCQSQHRHVDWSFCFRLYVYNSTSGTLPVRCMSDMSKTYI